MEHVAIGHLKETDQDDIEEQMMVLEETKEDPQFKEPKRDSHFVVFSNTPMNAKCPADLLTENCLTPPNLFCICHHHPMPCFTPSEF